MRVDWRRQVGEPPQLRARMQSKSCFNFRVAEPALIEELAALTKAAYEHDRAQGLA